MLLECPPANADPNLKASVLKDATTTLHQANDGYWNEKCNLASSHFNGAGDMSQASIKIKALKNPLSKCFKYEWFGCKNAQCKDINVPTQNDTAFQARA